MCLRIPVPARRLRMCVRASVSLGPALCAAASLRAPPHHAPSRPSAHFLLCPPLTQGTTLAVSASGAAAGAPLGNASVASLLSSGLITRQEASVYSSDQLAFLARKRSPSQRGAAARAAAASMPGAAGAGAAEVQAWLSRGVISKQAAATFSPEQLAFLARKRGGA